MLLDEIIDILSDSRASLTDALLKTKVLLHKIGQKELVTWVTNELQGYPDKNVPEYRIVSADVRGIVGNSGWQPAERPMPIQHLSKEVQDNLTKSKCGLSIHGMEQAVEKFRKKGGGLQMDMPPEANAMFLKPWSQGTQIFRVWSVINMIQVEATLTEVRSRLLDFLLELRDAVGEDTGEKDMVSMAETLDTGRMFEKAIFSGNNNTLVIGSGNVTSVTVTNTKDDIDGLVNAIQALGVTAPELEELKTAVLADEDKLTTPSVSQGETRNWFAKTLEKAGKGVYKATVDVVAATAPDAALRHSARTRRQACARRTARRQAL
jgi:hypothetical protein